MEYPGVDGYAVAATEWDPDGDGPGFPQLVVAETFHAAGRFPAEDIARWDPAANDGEGAWLPFGTGSQRKSAIGDIKGIVPWDPDGDGPQPTSLVAAGDFTFIGGVEANHIARWDPAADEGRGAWLAFDRGFGHEVRAVTTWDFDSEGPEPEQVVAAGYFRRTGKHATIGIARWNPTAVHGVTGRGLTMETQRLSPQSIYTMVKWDPDGSGPIRPRLVIGGVFRFQDPDLVKSIAYWDRAPDAAWDPDGPGPQPESLIGFGEFEPARSGVLWPIARWVPSAADGAGAWITLDGRVDSPLGVSWIEGRSIWDPDGAGRLPPRIALWGSFTRAGDQIAPYIASWGRDCLCPGDADGSLAVTFSDITSVLEHWGTRYAIPTGLGDPSGDGFVAFADVDTVLANFDSICP